MKKIIFLFALFAYINAKAQDVIVIKDGTTILSKVLEVNQNDVKYKKTSNLNGPTYTINRSDIIAINYQNGEKEVFNQRNDPDNNSTLPFIIERKADTNNLRLLSIYNRTYSTSNRLQMKQKSSHYFLGVLGVKTSSILSNGEIEVTFERDVVREPLVVVPGSINTVVYYIMIKNCTDKTIYIDKGNCFRIMYNGTYNCYYDNTQVSIGKESNSGISLGLGSIAGVLGISGGAMQLASGMSISKNSGQNVYETFTQQRVVAIPPHAIVKLSDHKWKNNIKLESAEFFSLRNYSLSNLKEIGLQTLCNIGEVRTFNETDLSWFRKYIITYSTSESFDKISTIGIELYIHQLIGIPKDINEPDDNKYIEKIDKNTIMCYGSIK